MGLTRCAIPILSMAKPEQSHSTTDAEGDTSPSDAPTAKRRRRLHQAPVEEITAPSNSRSAVEPATSRPGRWWRWRSEVLSNLGISPIFRAYIFLGSIIAILAFLLYSESLIEELREHEKSRVDLYAHLISFVPQASDEQTVTIFTEVITKVDFPRIITNHRGEIIQAYGISPEVLGDSTSAVANFFAGLAFWREHEAVLIDTAAVSTVELHRLIKKMDAQNPPISFYLSQKTPGLLVSAACEPR